MRGLFAILIICLPLAACGRGGGGEEKVRPVAGPGTFDRPDGSLDRRRYRVAAVRSCIMGMRSENAPIPPETVNRMCNCLVDRQIDANSDDVLRAAISDHALSRRTLDAAARQCGMPTPTDADMAPEGRVAPPGADDEPPPPPEPPPALPGQAETPPPLVQNPPPRR